jgi:putative spermidine/putrescine transport system permease protein
LSSPEVISGQRTAANTRGNRGSGHAFMASFDNVPISLFLRDANTDMLPIRMWQDLEGRLDVTIAALSGVMIAVTLALMLVMERGSDLSRRLR